MQKNWKNFHLFTKLKISLQKSSTVYIKLRTFTLI